MSKKIKSNNDNLEKIAKEMKNKLSFLHKKIDVKALNKNDIGINSE